jgi:predicted amidophosphoribosyltransferase
MRDRHIPRLCRSCTAPMGRQQDACWRCGAEWSTPAELNREGDPPAPEVHRVAARARVTAGPRAGKDVGYVKSPDRLVGAAG